MAPSLTAVKLFGAKGGKHKPRQQAKPSSQAERETHTRERARARASGRPNRSDWRTCFVGWMNGRAYGWYHETMTVSSPQRTNESFSSLSLCCSSLLFFFSHFLPSLPVSAAPTCKFWFPYTTTTLFLNSLNWFRIIFLVEKSDPLTRNPLYPCPRAPKLLR